jgi:uncharacterized protein (DUF58 family)
VENNVHPNIQTIRHSSSMAWYEKIGWDYRLKCTQRGLYKFGPTRVESGDPFGFLHSERIQLSDDSILVYPRIVPLPELRMPSAKPLGEVRGGIRIIEDSSRPSGIREYQLGDPLRIVDWKATARRQNLQVRTFESSISVNAILVAAIDTTDPYWAAYETEVLERVITAAASAAVYLSNHQYAMGLFLNDMPVSDERPLTVRPSRGREQLSLILGALATSKKFALEPIASRLSRHYRRFPMGSTLVVSTAFVPPELVGILNELKRIGHSIVVLYVGEGNCPKMTDGIVVHEIRDHVVELEESNEINAA